MFVKPSSAFVGNPSVVASSSGSAKYARYARLLPSTRKSSDSRAGASSRSSSTPVRVFGLTSPTLSSGADGRNRFDRRGRARQAFPSFGAAAGAPVIRVPLLSGTRLVVAVAPDDAVVLRPPPPGEGVAEVGAAVRDA